MPGKVSSSPISPPDQASTAESRLTGPAGPAVLPSTDGELLMRFVRHGDEAALGEVLDRHAAMVWAICTRVLATRHEAEDAYQATLLILAQKASTIRASDSAAGWLFRVAHRTALAARRRRVNRREESLVDEPLAPEEAFPAIHHRQTVAALLEELRGMPERYQTPLVMRYLEGQSRRAIADATDATIATVAGRLVRGRRMLRQRLARRGVSLAVAAGVFTGAEQAIAADAIGAPSMITPPPPFDPTAAVSTAVGQLVTQGVRSMLIASLVKPTAAAGACVVVALAVLADPLAPLAAHEGGPNHLALQTAPAEDTPDESPLIVVAANPVETDQGGAPADEVSPSPAPTTGGDSVFTPRITTRSGQTATIAVEREGKKIELKVTPVIKGDTVELEAEITTTELSESTTTTDQQAAAAAVDNGAAAEEELSLLAELVALKEQSAQAARARWLEGAGSAEDEATAAADLLLARVELAEARGEQTAIIEHLQAFVAHRERQLERVDELVAQADASPADAIVARQALVEAKLRLARARQSAAAAAATSETRRPGAMWPVPHGLPGPPHPRVASAAAPSPPANTAVISALQELRDSHSRVWRKIKALRDEGARGGSADREAVARAAFFAAKARLERVRRQAGEAPDEDLLELLQSRSRAAEQQVEAVRKAYDAGRVTLDLLHDAIERRAEAKIALAEAQQAEATGPGPPRDPATRHETSRQQLDAWLEYWRRQLRFAQAQAKVVLGNIENGESANERFPGAVSKLEIEKLKSELEKIRAEQALAEAKILEIQEQAAAPFPRHRFVPQSGHTGSSWNCLHRTTELNPHEWATTALLAINGSAPVKLPGDARPRPYVKLVEGDDDRLMLEIIDEGHLRHGDVFLLERRRPRLETIRGQHVELHYLSLPALPANDPSEPASSPAALVVLRGIPAELVEKARRGELPPPTAEAALRLLHSGRRRAESEPFTRDALRAPAAKKIERISILGPVTRGDILRALDRPSDAEILRAVEQHRTSLGHPTPAWTGAEKSVFEVQKTNEYFDPQRVYPLVGKAILHHAHYTCRIEGLREPIYIDHNHLHVLEEKDGDEAPGVTPEFAAKRWVEVGADGKLIRSEPPPSFSDAPTPPGPAEDRTAAEHQVTVSPAGQIRYNNREVTLDELEGIIRGQREKDPRVVFAVDSYPGTPTSKLQPVIDLSDKTGANLAVEMRDRRELSPTADRGSVADVKADRPSGRLSYGDGLADGKKSLGGSGHLIRFEMPEGVGGVKAIRVHGSRYGAKKAPKEDFEISFLNDDMSDVLAVERAAYGLFRRGDQKWVTVRFRQPVELPAGEPFWVGVDFDPGRTKGVYVSYDTATEGKHSKTGLAAEPDEVADVAFGGDWMVQVVLERGDDRRAATPGPTNPGDRLPRGLSPSTPATPQAPSPAGPVVQPGETLRVVLARDVTESRIVDGRPINVTRKVNETIGVVVGRNGFAADLHSGPQVQVAGMTVERAEQALKNANPSIVSVRRDPQPREPGVAYAAALRQQAVAAPIGRYAIAPALHQATGDKIQPGEWLEIEVVNRLDPNSPTLFTPSVQTLQVDVAGDLALGARWGRVSVVHKTLREVEQDLQTLIVETIRHIHQQRGETSDRPQDIVVQVVRAKPKDATFTTPHTIK